jgi:cobalt-zinc-cadmium efflux system membrane fusion protein
MKTLLRLFFSLPFLFVSSLTAAHAGGGHDHGHGHDDHGAEAHETQPSKGPHGGRLLSDGEFALEVTIFESGVPPQYRVYPFQDGKPLSPSELSASIELTRFGGVEEQFRLGPVDDYLSSPAVVREPHSFDVKVTANLNGKVYSWEYQSHEGRTELSEEALKVAKISVEVAGPQEISNVTHVYGRLLPNQDQLAHIRARFPGVVREIRKELGDNVEKGDLLAIVESNQSLQPYEIRSQIAGGLIARHATVGEFVSEDRELLVVADLSSVWADFQVYRDDFDQISRGQSIKVDLGGDTPLEATVRYVSPITDEATQSKLVRAILPNQNGKLRPGLFVSGTLASNQSSVPLAVRREAIQTFRDWQVVYLTDGRSFQAMPVELGRRDPHFVEVLSGIAPGDRYVARNSFIIKADIEKAGASHDH